MTASLHAELEALLLRLGEMRKTVIALAEVRNLEDLMAAEQALAQAEKLLRRVRQDVEKR